MQVIIYKVSDTHGQTAEGVVMENCDTLFLPGLRDKEGVHRTFESEPYHVGSWADRYGFVVEVHTVDLDLDKQVVNRWSLHTTDPEHQLSSKEKQ